jgi:hypothetical protein
MLAGADADWPTALDREQARLLVEGVVRGIRGAALRQVERQRLARDEHRALQASVLGLVADDRDVRQHTEDEQAGDPGEPGRRPHSERRGLPQRPHHEQAHAERDDGLGGSRGESDRENGRDQPARAHRTAAPDHSSSSASIAMLASMFGVAVKARARAA